MYIIYIPFAENKELLEEAQRWRKILWSKGKPAYIVSHGHFLPPVSLSAGEEGKIYIIGHGVDDQAYLKLYPKHNIANMTHIGPGLEFLSMEEVAERFSQDLGSLSNYFSTIKLYFCNEHGSEKRLAEVFANCAPSLVKDKKIDYYGASLTPPLPVHKYAVRNDAIIGRASRVRLSLFKESSDEKDESRQPVKQAVDHNWLKQRNRYFLYQKKRETNLQDIMDKRLSRQKMAF